MIDVGSCLHCGERMYVVETRRMQRPDDGGFPGIRRVRVCKSESCVFLEQNVEVYREVTYEFRAPDLLRYLFAVGDVHSILNVVAEQTVACADRAVLDVLQELQYRIDGLEVSVLTSIANQPAPPPRSGLFDDILKKE